MECFVFWGSKPSFQYVAKIEKVTKWSHNCSTNSLKLIQTLQRIAQSVHAQSWQFKSNLNKCCTTVFLAETVDVQLHNNHLQANI